MTDFDMHIKVKIDVWVVNTHNEIVLIKQNGIWGPVSTEMYADAFTASDLEWLIELRAGFKSDASQLYVLGYSETQPLPIVSFLYASSSLRPKYPAINEDSAIISAYSDDLLRLYLPHDTYLRYLKYHEALLFSPDIDIDVSPIIIKTPRLLLRAIQSDDFTDFYPLVKDKDIAHDLGRSAYVDEDIADTFLRYLIVNSRTLAIVDLETNKLIGNISLDHLLTCCCLDPQFKGKKGLSLSFALIKPYQHQGIMSEVLENLIPFIFNELHADFINCGYFYFNEASKKLQHKFGFHYYATSIIQIGEEQIETIDNILYKEEYEAIKKSNNQ